MKVIIVDDESYGESLKESCELHFNDILEFQYHQTLEAGLSIIKAEPENILLAVIDAKGQIDSHTSGSDEHHLTKALIDLGRLREEGTKINYVVHSAYSDIMSKYSNFFQDDYGAVIPKSEGVEAVINHIEEFIERHPNYLLERKFPSAYKALNNNVIAPALRSKLDVILSHFDVGKLTNDTDDHIGSMRKILEVVCYNVIDNLPPQPDTPVLKEFTDNPSSLDNAVRYITGNNKDIDLGTTSYSPAKGIVPEYITDAIWFVKNCSNKIGAHKKDGVAFSFNIYSSLCFALIEILDWYNDHMTN